MYAQGFEYGAIIGTAAFFALVVFAGHFVALFSIAKLYDWLAEKWK